MRIATAEVIVTSPDRNFVTLKLTTEDGVTGLGRRDPQRARTRRRGLPDRARGAAADRSRRAPHRGHLAVPLPRRVLAARPGDDDRDRRGGHGAVGHQGEGRRHAAVPAARRRVPHRRCSPTATPPAPTCRRCSTRSARTSTPGYRAIRIQTGVPGLGQVYGVARRTRPAGRALRLRTRAARRRPGRGSLGHPRLPAPPAHGVRGGAQRVRPGAAAAARRAPPADPEPGRAASARRSSPTTCSGWRTARPAENQAALRLVRAAHDHAAGDRRGASTRSGTTRSCITEQLIDYVRCAVTHAGGITALRKLMLDFAALYQVKSGMHGPTDVSPVGMAAALHLGHRASTTSASRST